MKAKERVLFCLLMYPVLMVPISTATPWTQAYETTVTGKEICVENGHKGILFERTTIPFTQLIVSWSAFRPLQGYFSLWVQHRHTRTKEWQRWYKMSEWGESLQKSYYHKRGNGDGFFHVRLESQTQEGDAFRVKVIAHDGASIDSFKGIVVSAANFKKFAPEVIDSGSLNMPSVYIQGVPLVSQMEVDHTKKEVLCSPTSCSMLVGHLTKQAIDPALFAPNVYDHGLGVYGSWPFNTAHAFEKTGGSFHFSVERGESFYSIYRLLQQNIPVVVSVRGFLPGGAKPYTFGHMVVVVGWDAQERQVICHDPAFATHDLVERRYALKDFIRAWERSRRLLYKARRA